MKRITAVVILLLSFINAQAEILPFKLPPELMTANGIIAPICFMRFTELSDQKKHVLNLKTDPCLQHKQPYNDFALKNELLGYDLKTDGMGMKQPYIFYRYIGKLTRNDQLEYAFLISWSGGGTGSFTELVTMTLDKDILTPKQMIAAGDRCNGSVKDAIIRDKQLHYQINATPYALYALNNTIIKPSQNSSLADCAVCCAGVVHFIDDVISGAQFNGELLDADPNDKQQACFNRIAKQFGANKKAFLKPAQLKRFQANVHKQCLDN